MGGCYAVFEGYPSDKQSSDKGLSEKHPRASNALHKIQKIFTLIAEREVESIPRKIDLKFGKLSRTYTKKAQKRGVMDRLGLFRGRHALGSRAF